MYVFSSPQCINPRRFYYNCLSPRPIECTGLNNEFRCHKTNFPSQSFTFFPITYFSLSHIIPYHVTRLRFIYKKNKIRHGERIRV